MKLNWSLNQSIEAETNSNNSRCRSANFGTVSILKNGGAAGGAVAVAFAAMWVTYRSLSLFTDANCSEKHILDKYRYAAYWTS